MAIAQMNWGRMKFAPNDARAREFMGSLATVYELAEQHPGFIWRIPDGVIASELSSKGFDNRMSATVSVWQGVEALRDYTFNTMHGAFLNRTSEWFEKVEGPQLVIWAVNADSRPSFLDAWDRLQHLKLNGPSEKGYGWPAQNHGQQ